jgi:phage gp46-like protein
MPTVVDTDLALQGQHLETSTGLETAVLVSLFSWAPAKAGDLVPPGQLYGWWGNDYPDVPGDVFGSRLWTLIGQPIKRAALQSPALAREALQWLLDDGLLTTLDVQADIFDVSENTVRLTITGTSQDPSRRTFLQTVEMPV